MSATFRLLRWLGLGATLLGGILAPASLRASDGYSFTPPFVEGVVIRDPAGNLSGDPNRGFMDIVETTLWDGDTEFILEVRMAAPFPTAREMAGGKRFDVVWLVDIDRNRATGQSPEGDDYNIHLLLDETGWHFLWSKLTLVSRADGIWTLPSAFSIDVAGDRARLTFPKAYLPSQSFEILAVCFGASDWTPKTQHPPTRRASYAQVPVLTVDESAREVALTVFRRDPTGSATVDFATADGTALGGKDFEATSGTLFFLAGQTNETIKIPLPNDGIVEGDESFSVRLMNPSGGASLGLRASAKVVIRDNDRGFEFSQSSVSVDEFAREAVLSVLRQDDLGGVATVDFATADGTARAGTDYTPMGGTLRFDAGETNKAVTIPLLDDRSKDVTTAFTVQLSHPSEWTSLGLKRVGTVVVARRPPPPEVIAWGVRYTGSSWLPATTPSELSDVVAVAAGEQHSVGLLANGRVVAWDVGGVVQPTIEGGLSNVVSIAAGSFNCLALTAGGRVLAWDALGGRQPVEIKGWSNIVAIAARGAQQLALTAAGRVIGLNGPAVPEELAAEQPGEFPFHRVAAIAAGYSHSLALTAEGGVVAWGSNLSGQTEVPAGLTNVGAIAAGEYHSLALTADGGVVAWGKYYDGWNVVPMTVPGGLSNVVAIAAGKSHSLALTAEGKVVGWGSYYGGSGMLPMTVPEGLSNVVSIAAGGGHSLALLDLTHGLAAPVWITPRFLVGAMDGAFYHRVTVKNGATSYTASGLPPGLVLDSVTGLISGVPTLPGSYSVALSATNSAGASATTATLFINQPAGAVISAPDEWVVIGAGSACRYQVVAYNEPERFAAIGLPRGLIINEVTGEITGTPLETGDFEVKLAAENRHGMASALLKLRVSGPVIIVPSERLEVEAGSTFRYQVVAYHGPERFTAVGLPLGLLIHEATGEITGTPVETGYFEVKLAAESRYGVAAALLKLRVYGPGISVPEEWVVAALGSSFRYQVVADNQPEKFAAIGLPRGLSISEATGEITGTPLEEGDVGVSLSASNRFGTARGRLMIRVSAVLGWPGAEATPRGASHVVAISALGRQGPWDIVYSHNLALTDEGRVMEWWSGLEDFKRREVPVAVSNVVAIAAGIRHSLALTADGRVLEWNLGSTESDDGTVSSSIGLLVPNGLSNVVAIAAGDSYSLALTPEGHVVAWGENRRGQTNVAAGLRNVVAIAAGPWHPLALTAAGRVVAWGDDEVGATEVPADLTNAVAIAAGETHSLALTADGRVVEWGQTAWWDPIPLPAGLSHVIAISAGWGYNLALTDGGRVVAWGARGLVEGTPDGLQNVVAIEAGDPFHRLALTSLPPDTAAPAWFGPRRLVATTDFPFFHRIRARNGAMSYGASGLPAGLALDATTGLITGVPERTGTYPLVFSATNRIGSCAWDVTLFVNGAAAPSIATRGLMPIGLGARLEFPVVTYNEAEAFAARGLPAGLAIDPQTGVISGRPVELGDFEVSLIASNRHGIGTALLPLRVSPLVAWGRPAFIDASALDVPGGLSNIVSVAAGQNHSMALTAEGRVIVWGEEWQTRVPAGLGRVVAIAAGSTSSLALTADGRVVEWGFWPNAGPAWAPKELSGVVAMAAGSLHGLALTIEGRVAAWGDNRYGQTSVPADLKTKNVVAIAAGDTHNLALTDDGHVVAWGNNSWGNQIRGPIDVPKELSNVVSIAAGDQFSLALTTEGRVMAWGGGAGSQTSVPAGLSNVVAIEAGGSTALALTADGRVVAWGDNQDLQNQVPSAVANAVSIVAFGSHGLALMKDPRIPAPRLTLSRTDAGLHLQAVGESGISCQLLRASDLSGPWLPTQAVTFTNRVQTLRTVNASQSTQFFRLLRK